jgi:hypothetical protein
MQRKHDLTRNKVIKHKARLNLHGGKQVYGVNYFETYSPFVTWFAIRLMIVFGIIFCWALWQDDFVMAYPHAPVETDISWNCPKVSRLQLETPRTTYEATQEHLWSEASWRVWNSFLVDKLTSLG